MQQQLFLCRSCGRDTLTAPHKPNCPVLQEQTNFKCRDFGMEPYYKEARAFPKGAP